MIEHSTINELIISKHFEIQVRYVKDEGKITKIRKTSLWR